MLKLQMILILEICEKQPPSGGCVLKLEEDVELRHNDLAATFGWLCVETNKRMLRSIILKRSHLRVAVC